MFENLVFPFPEVNDEKSDFTINPHPYFRGAPDVEGSKFTAIYETITKPVFAERSPRFHNGDLYLIFLAGNFPHVFDWDAEIDLSIGLYGEDEERYTITQPTIIRIPAGVWYCPMNFRVVNKPVMVEAFLMDEELVGYFNSPTAQKLKMRYNEPGRWEMLN